MIANRDDFDDISGLVQHIADRERKIMHRKASISVSLHLTEPMIFLDQRQRMVNDIDKADS